MQNRFLPHTWKVEEVNEFLLEHQKVMLRGTICNDNFKSNNVALEIGGDVTQDDS